MATSELSDNFCVDDEVGDDGDEDGDNSSHDSGEAIRRMVSSEARAQATDSMIAESGSR